jgi:hypothetical protein
MSTKSPLAISGTQKTLAEARVFIKHFQSV